MQEVTPQSYTLVITGAPYASQAPQTALEFARAARAIGHRIKRVFLYGDGVQLASALTAPPSDESHWPRVWAEFLTSEGIPGIVCIASALRRGLVDENERKRHELTASNLRPPFIIAGLGEWVEAQRGDSRVLYFHGAR